MASFDTPLQSGDETLTSTPTIEDLRAAIARPRGENWDLSLSRGENDIVYAALDRAGQLEVEVELRGESHYSEGHVSDEQLLAVFVSFLEDDNAWRDAVAWKQPPPPTAVPDKATRVPAPVVVALGSIAVGMGGTWLGFPRVGVFVAAVFVPALIGAAAYEKWREVRRASTWTKGTARILRSASVIETREDSDGHKTSAPVPAIEYEFTVGLKPYRGRRVSIGEILPGSPEVEQALKRYPAGGSATVYFDPTDPSRSVLERDPPAPFSVIFGTVGALAVAAGAAALWFTRHW